MGGGLVAYTILPLDTGVIMIFRLHWVVLLGHYIAFACSIMYVSVYVFLFTYLFKSVAHEVSFPIKYTIDRPRFQSNIPSNRWYIARIFQTW